MSLERCFILDKEYSKKDIYRELCVPVEKQRGNWDTGYTQYENKWYLFVNIDASGRTGHDYQNEKLGNKYKWYGKGGSKLTHPSIQSLLSPNARVCLFYRYDSRNEFIYGGEVLAETYKDNSPVEVIWKPIIHKSGTTYYPDEIREPLSYFEGTQTAILVNRYERSKEARDKCIEFYGVSCSVCNFNFEKEYGELGRGYIHVHHLVPLASISKSYELDPIKDLRPVCPNCHSMLHKLSPPLSISELVKIRK
jgi:5-methylcytosine-specific restriction protein A